MLWVKLYIDDMRSRLFLLSPAGRGAYVTLHLKSLEAQGPLPDNDGQLARACGMTIAQWRRVRPEVLEVLELRNGQLHDPMAERRIDEWRKRSATARDNVRKRWAVLAGSKLEDPQ